MDEERMTSDQVLGKHFTEEELEYFNHCFSQGKEYLKEKGIYKKVTDEKLVDDVDISIMGGWE